MSDERKGEPGDDPTAPNDQDDREAILERRRRFIKAAMAGLAGASIIAACGGDTTDAMDGGNPSPCLGMQAPDGARSDGTPQPCLGVSAPDATPQPCLEPPLPDAEADVTDATSDADAGDAIPQPCLTPPLPDSGTD